MHEVSIMQSTLDLADAQPAADRNVTLYIQLSRGLRRADADPARPVAQGRPDLDFRRYRAAARRGAPTPRTRR